MTEEINELERSISRYLDGECSPVQRRELEERIVRDPVAAKLFDEYAALDRQLQTVLRETVLRPAARPAPIRWWERGARVGLLAAAACLAVLLWFSPSNRTDTREPAQAGVHPHSWFAAPPSAGDTLVRRPVLADEPVTWVGKPQTDWIVIPTEKPNEFLVIQVDSIETQTSRESRDF